MKNFDKVEENTPFYDHEDQIGNNYKYEETPRAVFEKYVPIIKWFDHRSIIFDGTIEKCSIELLLKILHIQLTMEIPQNFYYDMWDISTIKVY